jgi:hypothetical protein
MDKNEKRRIFSTAFLLRLDEALGYQRSIGPVIQATSPVAQFGGNVEGPGAAFYSAKQSVWDTAARGNAGTGTPIPTLHGAQRQYATEAAVGGGTKANGGGGREAAEAALRKAGWSAAGSAALGWSALIASDIAVQVGPPMVSALWRARQDVKAAIRADEDPTDD